MLEKLISAIPLAITWMALTTRITLESFLVGLLISFIVLLLVSPGAATGKRRTLRDLRPWDRFSAAIVYIPMLFRDIYLSAMDVARRILDPKLPMNPGIIAVPTAFEPGPEDQPLGDLIAAASAHGITITPGELVIGFDGNTLMYVHCLDVEASSANAIANQAKRLALLKRIFG